ncbi:hypothetical protein E2C01_062608 [Portunus trituberculatus]|uniref:Uncharacterized protein n=1 Tax=Portunus trituberculatus TaxID=210409 RepID=A0A5B7HHS6_PORTR|nr:hypothetical protein [Portunus trituberculatus]
MHRWQETRSGIARWPRFKPYDLWVSCWFQEGGRQRGAGHRHSGTQALRVGGRVEAGQAGDSLTRTARTPPVGKIHITPD